MEQIKKSKIWGIIIAVLAVALVFASGSLVEDADKSKNYVCQMPMTGEYVVWTEGGLQWQGDGTVREYAKTSQIEFTQLEKNNEGYVAGGENPAAALTFNDIRWVPEIIMNGNSSNGSAMDAVGLNMMMDIVKKMNKEK